MSVISAGGRALARLILIVGVTGARCALAADSEAPQKDLSATPYRPTVSNPAALPEPGYLEWEAGVLSLRGQADDRLSSTPFLLKYAFNPDVGVLIGGDGGVFSYGAGESSSGWGDTTVTMKLHRLVAEPTAIGLEATVKLPTASAQLGSGHTDYTLNGIVSTEVSHCEVDVNVGYTKLGAADPGTGRGVLGWAMAVSHGIGGRWGVAGEISGTKQSGAPAQVQFLGALSYSLTPIVVLDTGALIGLDQAAPRYGVFTGVTMLMP
jgi:Putative MetA-pathway of phenol degradation